MNKLLHRILTTIDYQNDHEIFVTHFIENVIALALQDLIHTVDKQIRPEISYSLSVITTSEEFENTLQQWFSKTTIQQTISVRFQTEVTSYLEHISSSLNHTQKQRILELFEQNLSIKNALNI